MGMDQNNTDRFRKTSLFVDIPADAPDSSRPSQQQRVFSKNLNDDLRFSKISMSENKNNHLGYYNGNRGSADETHGEFSSFQIGFDGKLQKVKFESLVSKTRNRTTPDQLLALENVCKTTMRPNKEMRIKLASKLNMNQRQVQIWFQNKRAKIKKQSESAREQDSRELQKDDRAHQMASMPQPFLFPSQHNPERRFYDHGSNLGNPGGAAFLSNKLPYPGKVPFQPAPTSYLKNYCSLGNFYPRKQEEPAIYESSQLQGQYASPYYSSAYSEMPANNQIQYYEGESQNYYLVDQSIPRMDKMYCSQPRHPYQSYSSRNNKQF